MKEVKLRNGSKVKRSLVTATIFSLRRLHEANPIALYELVMKCKDRNHQFFGKTGDDLKALALVDQGGNVQEDIRNIILSATDGESLVEWRLVSPIAP